MIFHKSSNDLFPPILILKSLPQSIRIPQSELDARLLSTPQFWEESFIATKRRWPIKQIIRGHIKLSRLYTKTIVGRKSRIIFMGDIETVITTVSSFGMIIRNRSFSNSKKAVATDITQRTENKWIYLRIQSLEGPLLISHIVSKNHLTQMNKLKLSISKNKSK